MAERVISPTVNNYNSSQTREGKPTVGIIGTGNYASALSKRLTMAGYEIVMGSRHPATRTANLKSRNDCLCGVKITSIGDCIETCDLLFIAIHVEDFQITLRKFVQQTKGKILIDVSNRDYHHATQSNAEILSSILPEAFIVKAFNSISAFAMEDFTSSSDTLRVFVASNHPAARATVTDLAKSMSFRVVDLGSLNAAKHMEDFVLKVFPRWKMPLLLTFAIFNGWSMYIVYIYFIETTEYQWEQIFLKVLNKPLCMTAITILALTYLPGNVASILQIYNGTKHKRFPVILDNWLKCRKQFGLISFTLVSAHVIASVLMMSPTYYSSWFQKTTVTLPANTTLTSDLVIPVGTSWMEWKGEAACLVGITAFVMMVIIGLTSIPSVGESLNWSEWQFVHTRLGYLVLFLAAVHVLIMGAPGWAKDGTLKAVKSITFLSLILPFLVLLLKIILTCPPLKGYIWKIRRGWERPTVCQESLSGSTVDKQQINSAIDMVEVRTESGQEKDEEVVGSFSNGPVPRDRSTRDALSVTVQCECSAV